jgi:SPP1 family predicted phage head-tail adaptor
MMVAAGDLDRRVDVLRQVRTGVDSLNAPIIAWQVVRTVWAARSAKAESENFDDTTGQRIARRTVTFSMRFTADLSETDRLRCEGVTFNVIGIREIGFRDALEVTAEAGADTDLP